MVLHPLLLGHGAAASRKWCSGAGLLLLCVLLAECVAHMLALLAPLTLSAAHNRRLACRCLDRYEKLL